MRRNKLCIDSSRSLATATVDWSTRQRAPVTLANRGVPFRQYNGTTNEPRRRRHASLSTRTPAARDAELSAQEFTEKSAENMTSSRSFYVDTLILGKHRHRLPHHHHQQQQQHARRNDDMMLQLPLLPQSLPPLSHPAFAFFPYIARGRSTSPEVCRGTESGTASLAPPLPCLAATTALPTCLCPFCLPMTAAATGSPTHEIRQKNSESLLTARETHEKATSPTTQRREWQPWLQQTPAAAETHLLQSAPTNTELADRLQNHQFTITGLHSAICHRRSQGVQWVHLHT